MADDANLCICQIINIYTELRDQFNRRLFCDVHILASGTSRYTGSIFRKCKICRFCTFCVLYPWIHRCNDKFVHF